MKSFHVEVDPTNPGQFFACCGLLEMAHRLWPGAEGWFSEGDSRFNVACEGTLEKLIETVVRTDLTQTVKDDPYSSPIALGEEFQHFLIDWWQSDSTGAKDLKIWAGTMESRGIAYAMQQAMKDDAFKNVGLLKEAKVVMNPDEPDKKKEPYYFDSNRAPNAHARDVGYSVNDLGMTTTATPAVELLCLIGLQVARPAFTNVKRIYDYFTWHVPLQTNVMLAAATGNLELPGSHCYRFENWFRTGQRKHKAFRTASQLY